MYMTCAYSKLNEHNRPNSIKIIPRQTDVWITREKTVAELQEERQHIWFAAFDFPYHDSRQKLYTLRCGAIKSDEKIFSLQRFHLSVFRDHRKRTLKDLFICYIHRVANCALLNRKSQQDFLTSLFRRFLAAMLKEKPMPCNHVAWRWRQPKKPLGILVTQWHFSPKLLPKLTLLSKFHWKKLFAP